MKNGYAVIDLETTGFGYTMGDRIVEIAVITTDDSLEPQASWSSLINPLRDPGPTGVHGIKSEWLEKAPTFEQVAGDIQAQIQGRTLIVHNASFDVNFLKSEFRRAGAFESELNFDALCTLRLSRLVMPGMARYKLSWLAHELQLPTSPNHSAMADTQVTLELAKNLEDRFSAVSKSRPRTAITWFENPLEQFSAATIQRPFPMEKKNSNLLSVLASLPINGRLPVEVHEYLELLEMFLADDDISEAEAQSLHEAARNGGLGQTEIQEVHDSYFNALFSEALSDGVLTTEESASLRAKADLLGLRETYLQLENEWSEKSAALPFGLVSGDSVVLTGDTIPPKELLARQLQDLGLVVKTSVSKKTKLVAAADVNSESGKAQAARLLGIPLVSATELSSRLKSFNKR